MLTNNFELDLLDDWVPTNEYLSQQADEDNVLLELNFNNE